jgi:hypothetical protein
MIVANKSPNSSQKSWHPMLMLGLGFLGGFVMTCMRHRVNKVSLGVAPVNQTPTSNGVSDKVHDESVVGPYYKKAHICHENPYEGSLLNGNSFDTADAQAQAWMADKSNIRNALYAKCSDGHSHAKFNAFEVMAPCHQNCTGKCGADASKIVCGLQQ